MKRLGVLIAAALLAINATAANAADSALSLAANAEFLASYAKMPGVVVRPSGLEYRIIHSGFGGRPSSTDIVNVYYRGTLINGKQFDGTEPGSPVEFPVNSVIPGWTEALQLMREGDEWELVIPSNLAYGSRGAGEVIPPNQTLVFDVRLVKVGNHEKDESHPPINTVSGESGTHVALIRDGGTYLVPVLINGVIPLNFTVDSGAADVSIPADVVLTLVRTGTLTENDFIGSQKYQLADGSAVESKTFIIHSLKVGDRTVTNVRASISDVKGGLLLGQSFLEKFRSWSLDNAKHELVLQ